ncbi:MAG: DUF4125 family protein [Thermodesulfobacteriota bacterium]|nr:DUF4125 family protein [Thermodesulfobacteriota bacterium]
MSEREGLINKILGIELNMFLKVPTSQPTQFQEDREGFKLARKSVFELWSCETLKSYLNDLFNATRRGINVMTQKYARMDDLISPLNENPVIDEIVAIESQWQEEVVCKYPHIFRKHSPQYSGDTDNTLSFSLYLKAELETYSDNTLDLYYKDLQLAIQAKKNMIEERYTHIFQRLGYSSLEEANESLKEG